LPSHTFVAGVNQVPIDMNLTIPANETYSIIVVYNSGGFQYTTAANPTSASDTNISMSMIGYTGVTYNAANSPPFNSWSSSTNRTTNLAVWYDLSGPSLATTVDVGTSLPVFANADGGGD